MAKANGEKEQKRTLEQLFAELDQITKELDRDDLPLEEAFSKYQIGMQLLKECNEVVGDVEKKLQILEEGE